MDRKRNGLGVAAAPSPSGIVRSRSGLLTIAAASSTDKLCHHTLSVGRRAPFLPLPWGYLFAYLAVDPAITLQSRRFSWPNIKGTLSKKDNAAAKRFANRILDDAVSDHVGQILDGPKKRSEPKSMLDRPLPNGKQLRDCTSRDLLILGHAYAIAAEHLESGKPPAFTASRKTSKRRS